MADSIVQFYVDSDADLGVYTRRDCADPLTQTMCTDIELGASMGGMGETTLHAWSTAGETLFVFVDGFGPTMEGLYFIDSAAATPTEAEPNDDYMSAEILTTAETGFIQSGDHDWYSVDVPVGGTLTATTSAVFMNDCVDRRQDTEIEIYDTDGMTSIAFNDDIDPDNSIGNFCSTVTTSMLAGGTYYVRVSYAQMFNPLGTTGYVLDTLIALP